MFVNPKKRLKVFDWYLPDPVASPRATLVACKDAYLSVELFSLFSSLMFSDGGTDITKFNTIYPGDSIPPHKYDVLVLTFEPMTDEDRSWYHGTFLTLLAPGGKVLTCV